MQLWLWKIALFSLFRFSEVKRQYPLKWQILGSARLIFLYLVVSKENWDMQDNFLSPTKVNWNSQYTEATHPNEGFTCRIAKFCEYLSAMIRTALWVWRTRVNGISTTSSCFKAKLVLITFSLRVEILTGFFTDAFVPSSVYTSPCSTKKEKNVLDPNLDEYYSNII